MARVAAGDEFGADPAVAGELLVHSGRSLARSFDEEVGGTVFIAVVSGKRRRREK